MRLNQVELQVLLSRWELFSIEELHQLEWEC